MSKSSQEKYKKAGLCIFCGKEPRKGFQTCEVCAIRTRKNRRKTLEKRLANNKCIQCGSDNLVTKRHCEECRQKHQQSAVKNYWILRDEIFENYGGYVCTCCGETEKIFLTIDHINNDGAKHRKEIGSSNLYRWLRDNKYPEGFQVLCMNCQWGKRNCYGGVCPHQSKGTICKS